MSKNTRLIILASSKNCLVLLYHSLLHCGGNGQGFIWPYHQAGGPRAVQLHCRSWLLTPENHLSLSEWTDTLLKLNIPPLGPTSPRFLPLPVLPHWGSNFQHMIHIWTIQGHLYSKVVWMGASLKCWFLSLMSDYKVRLPGARNQNFTFWQPSVFVVVCLCVCLDRVTL